MLMPLHLALTRHCQTGWDVAVFFNDTEHCFYVTPRLTAVVRIPALTTDSSV